DAGVRDVDGGTGSPCHRSRGRGRKGLLPREGACTERGVEQQRCTLRSQSSSHGSISASDDAPSRRPGRTRTIILVRDLCVNGRNGVRAAVKTALALNVFERQGL